MFGVAFHLCGLEVLSECLDSLLETRLVLVNLFLQHPHGLFRRIALAGSVPQYHAEYDHQDGQRHGIQDQYPSVSTGLAPRRRYGLRPGWFPQRAAGVLLPSGGRLQNAPKVPVTEARPVYFDEIPPAAYGS
jgi:hypothetical protein